MRASLARYVRGRILFVCSRPIESSLSTAKAGKISRDAGAGAIDEHEHGH